MSLFIRVHVNDNMIGQVEITNRTGHTRPNDVNTYGWTFNGDTGQVLQGTVRHRYGDGAMVLANRVFGEIAQRYLVVAHLDHKAADVDSCPLCAEVAHV